MIRYQGPNFDIEDLEDFFSVGPVQKTKADTCEVLSSLIAWTVK